MPDRVLRRDVGFDLQFGKVNNTVVKYFPCPPQPVRISKNNPGAPRGTYYSLFKSQPQLTTDVNIQVIH